jgi:hypothetical protein
MPSVAPSAHPSTMVALAFADSPNSAGLLYQLSTSPDTPEANNVNIDKDGYFIFGDSLAPNEQSYLQLTYAMRSLKSAKVLTVEALVKYDNVRRYDSSTLFSFGTADTFISFPGSFANPSLDTSTLVHLAVVFNFNLGYTKVRSAFSLLNSKKI